MLDVRELRAYRDLLWHSRFPGRPKAHVLLKRYVPARWDHRRRLVPVLSEMRRDEGIKVVSVGAADGAEMRCVGWPADNVISRPLELHWWRVAEEGP